MLRDEFGETGRFQGLSNACTEEPPSNPYRATSSVQPLLHTVRPGVFEPLAQFLVDLLEVSTAYVTLADPERFYVLARRGLNRDVYRRDQLPDDDLLRWGRSHLVYRPGFGPRRNRGGGNQSGRSWSLWMGVPVVGRGRRVLGTVAAASRPGRAGTRGDVRCLITAAKQVIRRLPSGGEPWSPY